MSSAGVGYRPPNWGQTQTYSMTCTLPASNPTASNNNQNTTAASDSSFQPTTFFFDAVMRIEHVQSAIGTRHPVQVGPALIDHVYNEPARVTLEVAISDAMQSFKSGQYSSVSSRSVSAYQTFKQIQAARVPITLATRLDTYQNMYLADVRATETFRTFGSFRGLLVFEQIISAQVNSTTVSNRTNVTDSTNEGTKGVQPVPPELSNQIQDMPIL